MRGGGKAGENSPAAKCSGANNRKRCNDLHIAGTTHEQQGMRSLNEDGVIRGRKAKKLHKTTLKS